MHPCPQLLGLTENKGFGTKREPTSAGQFWTELGLGASENPRLRSRGMLSPQAGLLTARGRRRPQGQALGTVPRARCRALRGEPGPPERAVGTASVGPGETRGSLGPAPAISAPVPVPGLPKPSAQRPSPPFSGTASPTGSPGLGHMPPFPVWPAGAAVAAHSTHGPKHKHTAPKRMYMYTLIHTQSHAKRAHTYAHTRPCGASLGAGGWGVELDEPLPRPQS